MDGLARDERSLAIALNTIALYLVMTVLAAAFWLQFAYAQLPCPLCLLQRVAFCLMAAGLVFNLRYGPRARGYGLILLSAAVGGITGVRQILLHIAPGDPGYGMPVFGLHDYTWATIVFAIAIVATGIVLLFDKALAIGDTPRPLGRAATVAIWLAVGITVVNAASALVECGFAQCPDNPVSYELLSPSLPAPASPPSP